MELFQAVFAGFFSLVIFLAKVLNWSSSTQPVLLGTALVIVITLSSSMVWISTSSTELMKSFSSLNTILSEKKIQKNWEEDDWVKVSDPISGEWPIGG